MKGEQFHFSLTDDVKPFCINTPRSIPLACRDKLKAELDLLESQCIIAPVTAATEWCAPIIVTPKKNTDHISDVFTPGHNWAFSQASAHLA